MRRRKKTERRQVTFFFSKEMASDAGFEVFEVEELMKKKKNCEEGEDIILRSSGCLTIFVFTLSVG